jgi:hypothetical protein
MADGAECGYGRLPAEGIGVGDRGGGQRRDDRRCRGRGKGRSCWFGGELSQGPGRDLDDGGIGVVEPIGDRADRGRDRGRVGGRHLARPTTHHRVVVAEPADDVGGGEPTEAEQGAESGGPDVPGRIVESPAGTVAVALVPRDRRRSPAVSDVRSRLPVRQGDCVLEPEVRLRLTATTPADVVNATTTNSIKPMTAANITRMVAERRRAAAVRPGSKRPILGAREPALIRLS